MKKLYRTNSSTIGGVCDGLGAYFNIDETKEGFDTTKEFFNNPQKNFLCNYLS